MSEKEIIIYVFMFSIGDKKFFTTPVWLFHRGKTSISGPNFNSPPIVRCLIFFIADAADVVVAVGVVLCCCCCWRWWCYCCCCLLVRCCCWHGQNCCFDLFPLSMLLNTYICYTLLLQLLMLLLHAAAYYYCCCCPMHSSAAAAAVAAAAAAPAAVDVAAPYWQNCCCCNQNCCRSLDISRLPSLLPIIIVGRSLLSTSPKIDK